MDVQKRILYSSNSSLKSHPDKLLKDHLFNVGKYCRETLSSEKLNMDKYLNSDILQEVAYLVGVGHDFGKATSYFQKYINEKDKTMREKLKNKSETHHGLISAFFTYYLVKEYLLNKGILNEKYYEYLPIISFLVVKRHHGNLKDADYEIYLDEAEDEVLENQIKSINFEKLNKIYNSLVPNFDCRLIREKILHSEPVYIYDELEGYRKNYIKDLKKEKHRIRGMEEKQSLFFYFVTLLLYSILLDADKTDAANLEKVKRINISENLIDEYKKIKFGDENSEKSRINRMRNEIYKEAISNVKRLNLDKDKILSLNVPTGTGKTLTALSFALKLRKRIKEEKGYKARLIYSLPFLSIIDQNFRVCEDIFETVKKEKPTSELLLKHHHLSDVIYTKKADEFENVGKDPSKDLLLIEGWNSEIVVTTFIQFFYSLITNKNRAARKFHNMVNSIVILDEAQTVPHKYWLLLNKAINFFAKHFNTYFILMTATQPLIFDEARGEITPLVKNKKKYFNALNRVTLITNLEPIALDKFKEIIKDDIIKNPSKNFLIILNTIRFSKEIYKFISEFVDKSELYYLSTNIIPKERLARITEIKEREKKNNRSVIISTQLIEAGVDIDVDVVYRDFAPMDSINQACGRCNRNFGDKQGIVKLFVLMENKNGRTYYPYTIYGSFIISKTKEIFKETDKEKFKECEFFKLSARYFEKVNIAKSQDKSNEIIKDVEKLNFDELSKFKLIEKDYPDVDIFVESDKYAQSVWKKYEEIQYITDAKERRNKFLTIKKDFYDYVISVPYRINTNLPPLVYDFYYVSNDQLKNYYNEGTGFHSGEVDIY